MPGEVGCFRFVLPFLYTGDMLPGTSSFFFFKFSHAASSGSEYRMELIYSEIMNFLSDV